MNAGVHEIYHFPFEVETSVLVKKLGLGEDDPFADEPRRLILKAQEIAKPRALARIGYIESCGDEGFEPTDGGTSSTREIGEHESWFAQRLAPGGADSAVFAIGRYAGVDWGISYRESSNDADKDDFGHLVCDGGEFRELPVMPAGGMSRSPRPL